MLIMLILAAFVVVGKVGEAARGDDVPQLAGSLVTGDHLGVLRIRDVDDVQTTAARGQEGV